MELNHTNLTDASKESGRKRCQDCLLRCAEIKKQAYKLLLPNSPFVSILAERGDEAISTLTEHLSIPDQLTGPTWRQTHQQCKICFSTISQFRLEAACLLQSLDPTRNARQAKSQALINKGMYYNHQNQNRSNYPLFSEVDPELISAKMAMFAHYKQSMSSAQPKNYSVANSISSNSQPDSASIFLRSKPQLCAKLMSSDDDAHPFPTNFGEFVTKTPPPAPPGLFRNLERRSTATSRVKVALRVSPLVSDTQGTTSNGYINVDQSKKQITLIDGRELAVKPPTSAPKLFGFDYVFPEDAAQAEICASTLSDVLQAVVNGSDGCVFCYGRANLGKTYTMVGEDKSLQTIGMIPCAISWLFRLINDQKQKTGARFSVRVSAIEISGKNETIKDLLVEQATSGSTCSNSTSPGVFLREDPVGGVQMQNQSELRTPNAEKAAFLLDAALYARAQSKQDNGHSYQPNHFIYTLHVYQYRVDKVNKGGVYGGRSRLHLIDLGNCDRPTNPDGSLSTGGTYLSYAALSNVVLSLMNGAKHVPHKESKLTQLLRDAINSSTCRTVMITHVSQIVEHYEETLASIQLAAKIHRCVKKRKTKVLRYGGTSSSSEYTSESSCDEGSRRPIISRNLKSVREDFSCSDLDSSSEGQSCDTVIYRGPDGRFLSDNELTDQEHPPARLSPKHCAENVNTSSVGGKGPSNKPSITVGGSSSESDKELNHVNSDSQAAPFTTVVDKLTGQRTVIQSPVTVSGQGVVPIDRLTGRPLVAIRDKLTGKIAYKPDDQVGYDTVCQARSQVLGSPKNHNSESEDQDFIPRMAEIHKTTRGIRGGSLTSDSSNEQLNRISPCYASDVASPHRAVASDSEIVLNRFTYMSSPLFDRNQSHLSFISEENESLVNGSHHANSVASTSAAKSVSNMYPFKELTKKAASNASFFRSRQNQYVNMTSGGDIWVTREFQDAKNSMRSHSANWVPPSNGQRLQNSALLVTMGPQFVNNMGYVNQPIITKRRSSYPDGKSDPPCVPCAPPQITENQKQSFLSKLLRFSGSFANKKSRSRSTPRCAYKSPGRKCKPKIPTVSSFSNRTPESSPPPTRKSSSTKEPSTESEVEACLECVEITTPQTVMPNRESFTFDVQEGHPLPSENNYETIDRNSASSVSTNPSQQNKMSNKTKLIQKFTDSQMSYVGDYVANGISNKQSFIEPLPHPDILQSHSRCACQQLSGYNSDVVAEQYKRKLFSPARKPRSSSVSPSSRRSPSKRKSMPCSPFQCGSTRAKEKKKSRFHIFFRNNRKPKSKNLTTNSPVRNIAVVSPTVSQVPSTVCTHVPSSRLKSPSLATDSDSGVDSGVRLDVVPSSHQHPSSGTISDNASYNSDIIKDGCANSPVQGESSGYESGLRESWTCKDTCCQVSYSHRHYRCGRHNKKKLVQGGRNLKRNTCQCEQSRRGECWIDPNSSCCSPNIPELDETEALRLSVNENDEYAKYRCHLLDSTDADEQIASLLLHNEKLKEELAATKNLLTINTSASHHTSYSDDKHFSQNRYLSMLVKENEKLQRKITSAKQHVAIVTCFDSTPV